MNININCTSSPSCSAPPIQALSFLSLPPARVRAPADPPFSRSRAATEVEKKVDSKVDSKVDKKFDNTDFESFPQVKSQKDKRWGSIAKEELVWFRSFPALVVPPALHLTVNSDIQIPTHDGVMTYGPSAKGVTPAKKREYMQQVYAEGGRGRG